MHGRSHGGDAILQQRIGYLANCQEDDNAAGTRERHGADLMNRARLTASLLLLVASVTGCGASGDKSGPATASRKSNEFNADSAMSYIRQQLAFGPRVPGTAPARKTGDWIVARLRATADTVLEQKWTHTLADGKPLPMRNIFARFKPNAKERILYVTHWDTRPTANEETDPAKAKLPIPGANDGASGVALLLAVSDALRKAPPNVGVDLLFVDGEDWGTFTPNVVDALIGSSYFAEHLPNAGYAPLFGVLWDMIGDADLDIYQEVYSAQAAPEVVQKVWGTAKDLGYAQYFIPEAKGAEVDDQVPLIKAGFRVIDVGDFDYGPRDASGNVTTDYHHTLADTYDKVSAKSMKIVGDVAITLLR
jgi:glutaminyl-peptide cyclotransferase